MTRTLARRSRVLALVVLLTGSYAVAVPPPKGGWMNGKSLHRDFKLLVMSVADGAERQEGTALGSGAAIAASVRDYVVSQQMSAMVGDSVKLVDAFVEAERMGCGYVMKVVITEWEDNATAWSGKSDAVGISLEMYEVVGRELAATCSYRKKSSSFTLASNSPEQLIERTVQECPGMLWRRNR